MRDRTLLLLVVFVVLAITVGLGQVLKAVFIGALVLVVAVVALVSLLVWRARRRMRRSLLDLQRAVQEAQRQRAAGAGRPAGSPDIIDVEAKEARGGPGAPRR